MLRGFKGAPAQRNDISSRMQDKVDVKEVDVKETLHPEETHDQAHCWLREACGKA